MWSAILQRGRSVRCSGWILGKTSQKSSKAVAQAAQGGGGVTVPGGVQEPCGCGTEDKVSGHGGDGRAVGLDDLGLSSLNGSIPQCQS